MTTAALIAGAACGDASARAERTEGDRATARTAALRAQHAAHLLRAGRDAGAAVPPWVAELYAARLADAAAVRARDSAWLPPPPDAEAQARVIANAPRPHYLAAGDDGALRRWGARATPLGVWVAPPPPAADSLPGLRGHVGVLFARWNAAGAGVTFAPTADSAAAAVHVTWADAGPPARAARGPRTVQTGHTTLVAAPDGYAVGAHVTLWAGFPRAVVQDAALHEAGHALGLGHSADPHDVMTPVTDGRHHAPTAADVNTLRLLYTLRPGG